MGNEREGRSAIEAVMEIERNKHKNLTITSKKREIWGFQNRYNKNTGQLCKTLITMCCNHVSEHCYCLFPLLGPCCCSQLTLCWTMLQNSHNIIVLCIVCDILNIYLVRVRVGGHRYKGVCALIAFCRSSRRFSIIHLTLNSRHCWGTSLKWTIAVQ